MTAKTEALPICRAQYGAFDRGVAARSESEAKRLLGTDNVHGYHDDALARRLRRKPGVVFKKVHGVKAKYEVW